MPGPLGLNIFQLAYQVSPIFLKGGIATDAPTAQGLPIINITDSADFDGLLSDLRSDFGPANLAKRLFAQLAPVGVGGGLLSAGVDRLLSSSQSINLDEFFAQYIPINATLVDNSIATYPFANQEIAANAVIVNPLTVSLRMICPVRGSGGYANLMSTMSSLKTLLAQHTNLGGRYTVATPSCFYEECLLQRLVQISGGPKQAQSEWRWDFIQPLLTLQQAAGAQSNFMQKVTNATAWQSAPTWSGINPITGGSAPNAAGVLPSALGASSSPTAPSGFNNITGALQQ